MIVATSTEAHRLGIEIEELVALLEPQPGELVVYVHQETGPMVPQRADPDAGLPVAPAGNFGLSSPVIATQRLHAGGANPVQAGNAVSAIPQFDSLSVRTTRRASVDADDQLPTINTTITLADLQQRARDAGRMLYPEGPGYRLDGPGGGWSATLAGIEARLDGLSPSAPAITLAPRPHTRWVNGLCLPDDRM